MNQTRIPMRERLSPDKMRHRTPCYIYARSRQYFYDHSHPGAPRLTPEATRSSLVSDHGLEFGSGHSTIWFASRVGRLTSVEHDANSHSKVSGWLLEWALGNVEYILAPRDRLERADDDSDYPRTALAFASVSPDLALIDRICRGHTLRYMLPWIKPGERLIVHNVNWYLPSGSRRLTSRPTATGSSGQVWAEVADELTRWRRIWTSSCIWDTTIYIKPGSLSA